MGTCLCMTYVSVHKIQPTSLNFWQIPQGQNAADKSKMFASLNPDVTYDAYFVFLWNIVLCVGWNTCLGLSACFLVISCEIFHVDAIVKSSSALRTGWWYRTEVSPSFRVEIWRMMGKVMRVMWNEAWSQSYWRKMELALAYLCVAFSYKSRPPAQFSPPAVSTLTVSSSTTALISPPTMSTPTSIRAARTGVWCRRLSIM